MAKDRNRLRKTYSTISQNPSADLVEIVVDQALNWKRSARVASTSNLPLFGGGTLMVDNITLRPDDRILLKDQNNASQNGIYYYRIVSGSYSLIRDIDAVQDFLKSGTTLYVEEGHSNGGTFWVLKTIEPIIVDVTNQTWQILSSGAGGGGGSSIGTDITLGTPSDGSLTNDDALLSWSSSTTVTNALDEINEILGKLAPQKPQNLSSYTLSIGYRF